MSTQPGHTAPAGAGKVTLAHSAAAQAEGGARPGARGHGDSPNGGCKAGSTWQGRESLLRTKDGLEGLCCWGPACPASWSPEQLRGAGAAGA